MYAIFVTGGKQYKVAAGDVVRVEKLPQAKGEKITFDKVLAVNDGTSTQVGTPYLDAATVDTTVTAVGRGEKVIVYKFKAKKDYRRKQGHRQPFTEIRIESVSVGGKVIFKAEAIKETVKKDKPAKDASNDADKTKKDSTATEKSEAKDAATDVVSEDTPDTEDVVEEASEKVEVATEDVNDVVEVADDSAEQTEPTDDDEADSEDDATESDTDTAKLKKADIMALLDEKGIEYSKSAKKDELLALLEE